MFQALRQKITIYLKIAVVAIFLFMSTFGLWHSFLMPMNSSGEMAGCPIMGESSLLCRMSAVEHIQMWQAMFTAILLLAVAMLFTLTIYQLWYLSHLRLFKLHKLYIKEHPHLSINPLKEVFSQGILNPRISA